MTSVNNEVEVIKQAAHRLQEFLATKNIKLQHTVALEALTASLGSRNWRTLRDKLNETGPVAAKALTLDDLDGQQWLVRGIDSPTTQAVRTVFSAGMSPLDAKVRVLYRCLAARDQITVVEVEDRLTGTIVDTVPLHCSNLRLHSVLFKEILKTSRSFLGVRGSVKQDDLDAWAIQNLALEYFEDALESKKLCEDLDNFTYILPDMRHPEDAVVGFAASDDTFLTFTVPQALYTVLEYLQAQEPRMTVQERTNLYQFDALLENFAAIVGRIVLRHNFA